MGFIEKKVGNHMMRLNPAAGGIHNSLIKIANKGGEREPELLYLLRKEIEPGMKVLDLGANIGYATLLMCELVGKEGKVLAIEPDPANYETLKYNINLNKYNSIVRHEMMGVSNKEGMSDFYVGKMPNLGSMTKHAKSKGKPIQVKVQTLTRFFADWGFPQLIKMDIEGHEVEVLEGMFEAIHTCDFPCKIVMELHPVFYSETHSLEYWIKKFLDNGFKTKYVVSAAKPIPDLYEEWGYTNPILVLNNKGVYDRFSDEHMLRACCHENKQWMVGKNKFSPKIARFLMIER